MNSFLVHVFNTYATSTTYTNYFYDKMISFGKWNENPVFNVFSISSMYKSYLLILVLFVLIILLLRRIFLLFQGLIVQSRFDFSLPRCVV